MSKREVEALLAARFPRPDVPSRITRARVEPLSETRFKVEFTATGELREKLELCRDLMSHANPNRDLGVVIERAVDLLLDDLRRKRLARTKRSHGETPLRGSKPGRITSASRRAVFERDGLSCTYVSPEGRRCETRAFLELDHAEPKALGGAGDTQNLRVRCRAHNQLSAEQVFGREHLECHQHLRRQKWKRPPREGIAPYGRESEVLEERVEQQGGGEQVTAGLPSAVGAG
jgi:5-methylcytosine-specific restriction endonuclease McrA